MDARSNKKQNIMIIMCWMVYTFAYFGRYSFNSNITPIMADYSVEKADAGLVSTFFFFAYAVGQVVNGFMSRRYNKRYIFPLVLILSSVLNISFLYIPFNSFKYVWAANGFLQSILWSSIISFLSTSLDSKHMNRALLILSTTSTAGTVMTYASSALFVWLGNYRYAFAFGAVAMSTAAVLWLITYSGKSYASQSETKDEEVASSGGGIKVLIVVFACLAFFGVADNLIKDGLNTWVPTILTEEYDMASAVSILSTIVLPILGMLGAVVAVRLNKIISDFVSLIALFFTASAVFIGVIVVFDGVSPVVMIICFGIVTLFMHSINNVITAIAPLKLRDKVDSGKLAGILNGFCYLGSTLSSYGLGAVADYKGWNAVFVLIFGMCISGVVIGALYATFSKLKTNKGVNR